MSAFRPTHSGGAIWDECTLSFDNLLNNNYRESRVTPGAAALYRVHGPPRHPFPWRSG